MTKVNQEELQAAIEKLKGKAAAAVQKAGDKKADPEAREARKKVKRAQRKLRAAKSYKGASKKAAEKPTEGQASA